MSDFLDDLPDLGIDSGSNRKRQPKRRKPKASATQRVVVYMRPRCPRCGSEDVPVYNSNHIPIRYHKCRNCGLTFKSVEKTSG